MENSKGTFSLIESCVSNNIPKKGIAIAKENKAKIADRILNITFSPAFLQYGLMYTNTEKSCFIVSF